MSNFRLFKLFFSVFFFLQSSHAKCSEGHPKLAILTGLTSSFVHLQANDELRKSMLRDGIGPGFGVFFTQDSFELGFFYLNYKLKDVSSSVSKMISSHYSTSFLSVPLLYRFSLDQLRVGFGPSFSVRVSDEEFFSTFNYGLTLSVRFFGEENPVFLDARYNQGLKNLMNSSFQGSYPIVLLSSAQLFVGYEF